MLGSHQQLQLLKILKLALTAAVVLSFDAEAKPVTFSSCQFSNMELYILQLLPAAEPLSTSLISAFD